MTKERLNNTLKVHRAMRDWTQAQLAEHAGVTRKSINAIERGHFVPSTVLALRLAHLFECRVEDLFSLPD
ncbi:MAG: helix-turn-helix transcriptional regulator [Pseudomonadota bacterium]